MEARSTGQVGRRALFAAGLGGAALALAEAIGAPARTLAANGAAMLIGRVNTGTVATQVKVPNDPALKCTSDKHDGLWGQSKASGRSGVYGFNSHAGGFGVTGRNTDTGVNGSLGGPAGVQAKASGERIALDVVGRARFSRSGGIMIPKGSDVATLELGVGVAGPNTKVFATLQTTSLDGSYNSDNWVASAHVNEIGRLVVSLKDDASRDLWVAWLLLE
jgi:hypothetical protein